MTKEYFTQYLSIIQKKYDLHREKEQEWNDWKIYSQGLIDEVEEVSAEVKDNNAVYLEDELGDIFFFTHSRGFPRLYICINYRLYISLFFFYQT